ncbi:MAG: hypothetical protein AAFR51_06005 [Pseudomonadota bacterium]
MTRSVILRRCATLPEALICQALLTDRGFLASLDNAEHAAMDWGMVSALGGIQIRVPVSQADDAKKCIIDQVTHADEILEQAALPGDDIPQKSRWKAVSMLLIYFGIIELVGSFGLIWLDKIVPSAWLPPLNQPDEVISYWIGGSIAPPGPGIDGLVFLFFLVLLLVWELFSSRPATSNQEPQL